MNYIIFDKDSFDYLDRWVADFKSHLYEDNDLFNECCLQLMSRSNPLRAFVKKKHDGSLKMSIKTDHIIAKAIIFRKPLDDSDLTIGVKEIDTNIKTELIEHLIQVCATAYINGNLFLIYGNFLNKEDREYVAVGKNTIDGKTIVFRPFKETLYAVEAQKHRSPEGIFEVRGHFRHYEKTGKVIWIEPYMKGTKG